MNRLLKLTFATGVLSLAACWHATIETGLAPSNQVIEKSFAASWIIGLVPPKTLETQAKCPNGVSKVETQLSFVNQLVALLTLDIYTPMNIKVTCAEAGRSAIPPGAPRIDVGHTATPTEVREAFGQAATQASRTGAAVYIEFN
jgi:hypothetical protein